MLLKNKNLNLYKDSTPYINRERNTKNKTNNTKDKAKNKTKNTKNTKNKKTEVG